RVRSLLAEALAERMLARAEQALADGDPVSGQQRERRREPRRRAPHPAPSRPRRAAPDPRQPAPTTEEGWYVYGIVEESFEAPPMRGVDDEHRLEVVPAAGLAALTSRVPLAVFGEPALQEQIE